MNNNIWKVAKIVDEETGLLKLSSESYYGQAGLETVRRIIDKLNSELVLNSEPEYFAVVVGHK